MCIFADEARRSQWTFPVRRERALQRAFTGDARFAARIALLSTHTRRGNPVWSPIGQSTASPLHIRNDTDESRRSQSARSNAATSTPGTVCPEVNGCFHLLLRYAAANLWGLLHLCSCTLQRSPAVEFNKLPDLTQPLPSVPTYFCSWMKKGSDANQRGTR